MKFCTTAVVAITLFSACADLVGAPSADQRVVGVIEWQPSVPADTWRDVLAAPDTVAAGAAFDVTIATVGRRECWRQDGADVAYETKLAVVTPYDLVMTKVDGAPVGCAEMLVQLPRTVRLVFGQTGVATLRVRGRRVTGGELSSATPATVEKQIVVR